METQNKNNPWTRYANYGLIHCRKKEEVVHVLEKRAESLKECKP